MSGRLPTHILVSALLQRINDAGGIAVVRARGDRQAGAILVIDERESAVLERGIGPDATVHLDFALQRLAGVVERLNVYPENMQKNLDRLGGLVFSQRVMLALTQAGVSREDAYAAVQENAMKVWRGEGVFLDFLKADARVTLPADQLAALFDLDYHTKNVDVVFKRVFGEG